MMMSSWLEKPVTFVLAVKSKHLDTKKLLHSSNFYSHAGRDLQTNHSSFLQRFIISSRKRFFWGNHNIIFQKIIKIKNKFLPRGDAPLVMGWSKNKRTKKEKVIVKRINSYLQFCERRFIIKIKNKFNEKKETRELEFSDLISRHLLSKQTTEQITFVI